MPRTHLSRDAHPDETQRPKQPNWRQLHDSTFSELEPLPCLVAGTIFDDIWTISFTDPAKKRKAQQQLKFDGAVNTYDRRLNSPEHAHDHLTLKLMMYWALHPTGWVSSELGASHLLNAALYPFVRWRLDRQLFRNADLTKAWFEEYFSCARKNGSQTSLLSASSRVAQYLEELETGQATLPFKTYSPERPFVDRTAVARRLGFESTLQIAKSDLKPILDYLARSYPKTYERVLRTQEPGIDPTRIKKVRYQSIARLLEPWNCLGKVARKLSHDPPGFLPFSYGSTPLAMAKGIGVAPDRTKDIPPQQACELINAALHWVSHGDAFQTLFIETSRTWEEAPHPSRKVLFRFKVLSRAVQQFRTQLGDEVYLQRLVPKFGITRRTCSEEFVDLRTLLFTLLPAACLIVILSFTARRVAEAESLRIDSLDLDQDGAWLSVYVQKSLRDIDRIPIPASVVKAIDILIWLSAERRDADQTSWLFQFTDPREFGRNTSFRSSLALKQFVAFIGLKAPQHDPDWRITPHQFRRFFAIVYFYRFAFPHLSALTIFLGHYDPSATRHYCSNAVLGSYAKLISDREADELARKDAELALKYARQRVEDFETERRQFVTNTFYAIASNQLRVGGFGGDRIKADLAALVAEANRIVMIEPSTHGTDTTLDKMIQAYALNKVLEPHPQGHSLCKCSSNPVDLAAAACLALRRAFTGNTALPASGPDYAYAEDLVCSGCPHNVAVEWFEGYWHRAEQEASELTARSESQHLREASEDRAKSCCEHRLRCFGKQQE
jgi:integrase